MKIYSNDKVKIIMVAQELGSTLSSNESICLGH